MTTHLTYYEVLGLDEPPADRKAVKRAYSKKLKVTRPEDDPDGFMRLRDAHDLALNILANEAANATWEAQQVAVETTYSDDNDIEPTASENNNLTYADMLPGTETEPVSDTSYAIGTTPSLDAPPPSLNETDFEAPSNTSYAIGATPNLDAPPSKPHKPEPQAPFIIAELDSMLGDPNKYNSRENWNQLFRKARQLDIDDYVDFEELLLERILGFHGYYDQDTNLATPEQMPRYLSPSISASLFKTMSWDQVNTQGYIRRQQIEWLERRMSVRKRTTDAVPIPEARSDGNKKVWAIIFGAFILLQLIRLMVNL